MKAQIYNYAVWVDVTNPNALYNKYSKLLSESGFNVLNVIEKHFEPFGYTALFLLSESHFAIHTFPEHKETYIELSSCVKEQFDLFVKNH